MRRPQTFRLKRFILLLLSAGYTLSAPVAQAEGDADSDKMLDIQATGRLSALPVWDDGLSEMCYYRAVDRIYNLNRAYTRVHLVNRQWMNRDSGVKSSESDPQAVPVFKLNVAEEIPTENYNYRFLTTVFLERPALTPFKAVVSSQEWCGTTFKHLRYRKDHATLKSFSYFPEEGDREWKLDADVVPFEALILIAREVAATREERSVKLLLPLRTTREADPQSQEARLTPQALERISVDAGTFDAVRVDVDWDGPPAGFVVATEPPYLLLRYRLGGARGDLMGVERRAYWDRDWSSQFHETGNAP